MNEMTKADPNLPAFMSPDDVDMGTENLAEFIRPPRLRVVQALSKTLKDEFCEGDTVVLPQRVLMAANVLNETGRPSTSKVSAGEKWHFVPLFFWAEWITWNPREITDEDAIVERTTDRNSPLVAKCRDSNLWSEPIPGKLDKNGNPLCLRHCEHLNFLVMPLDTVMAGTPVCISFSRSEHKVGSSFAALIKMRKAPLFGCIFEASSGYRENPQGAWYGLDVRNPAEDHDSLVSDEDLYNNFKAAHEEFKKAHAANMIVVDLQDEGETKAPKESDDF